MSSPTPRRPNQHKQTKKKSTALSPWAWVLVVLGGLVLLGSLWGTYKFYMWWNPPAKYERDFSLQWDEEVKLHDGRMIVVNIKRKFRRQYLHLEYERVWYLGTEISFDAGEPWGRYTRYFQGYEPLMIENYKGVWYLHLEDASPGSGPKPRIVQEVYPVLMLLKNGEEKPVRNWQDVPDFPLRNVMDIRSSAKNAKFYSDQKFLSWSAKNNDWVNNFPRGLASVKRGVIHGEYPLGVNND